MTGLPDRCERCLCDDCGHLLTSHTDSGCKGDDCSTLPELACTRFVPSARIAFIADQLAPLLSAHLGPRQRDRCTAVAHAAHHALIDYDHPGDTR